MTSTKRSGPTPKAPIDRYANAYGSCPSDAVPESKYFHSSSQTLSCSPPIVNGSHRTANTPPATPEVIASLCFDPLKWDHALRPANWVGRWPPTSAAQLMNTDFDLALLGTNRQQNAFLKRKEPLEKDLCLGKWCWQTFSLDGFLCARNYTLQTVCTHSFTDWAQGCTDWQSRFEIREKEGMRYGLYSKCRWRVGDVLAPYLGELIPFPTANTDYYHEVKIGPNFSGWPAPVAYVDAERYGYFTRFANHSCEGNAVLCEDRVRDVEVGDEVCVDYGVDYFRDRRCLCGAGKCMSLGKE
ncbi:SET domain-containing protein [Ophiobolus disseminans]|uniref:SET domain-containing protein n=1 Tax=Ophiobolus disseminans TaxID=1469910 RepID=A0A6A7AFG7_9PLEO|nr:SET domain-containing protein [Ophiobolus disseminans]